MFPPKVPKKSKKRFEHHIHIKLRIGYCTCTTPSSTSKMYFERCRSVLTVKDFRVFNIKLWVITFIINFYWFFYLKNSCYKKPHIYYKQGFKYNNLGAFFSTTRLYLPVLLSFTMFPHF